jgi:hypothetical protein
MCLYAELVCIGKKINGFEHGVVQADGKLSKGVDSYYFDDIVGTSYLLTHIQKEALDNWI